MYFYNEGMRETDGIKEKSNTTFDNNDKTALIKFSPPQLPFKIPQTTQSIRCTEQRKFWSSSITK